MIRKIAPYLLLLFSCVANSASTGSGFFITNNGYFITNAHVISDAKVLFIRTVTGEKHEASVIRIDAANDIAILKIDGKFSSIPVDTSTNSKRGAKIVTVGFPHTDLQGIEPKITEGIINSLTGLRDDPRYFQISAQLGSGNSGGPLVNVYGNVIGIVSAKLKADTVYAETGDLIQNVNYAIKSNYLLEIINSTPSIKPLLYPVNKKQIINSETLSERIEKSIGLVINLNTEDIHTNRNVYQSDKESSKNTEPKVMPAAPKKDSSDDKLIRTEVVNKQLKIVYINPIMREDSGEFHTGDIITECGDTYQTHKIQNINDLRMCIKSARTTKARTYDVNTKSFTPSSYDIRFQSFYVLRDGKTEYVSLTIEDDLIDHYF